MANLDNGVMLGALGNSARIGAGSLAPPSGMVIAAIQFVGKATITGLTAEDNDKWINVDVTFKFNESDNKSALVIFIFAVVVAIIVIYLVIILF